MASIFSKIVIGEIPCYKIAEDKDFLAFLDINPIVKGHTLIIPKIETDYLFDIEDPVLEKIMLFSKKVAKAIEAAIPCKRVGVAVLGLEVPHAHIHLIPINSESDISFSKSKLKLTPQEFEEIAVQIKSKL
jgi:histidine triad (HIT) family protein